MLVILKSLECHTALENVCPPTAQCQVTTYLFWFPHSLYFQHLLESAPSGGAPYLFLITSMTRIELFSSSSKSTLHT